MIIRSKQLLQSKKVILSTLVAYLNPATLYLNVTFYSYLEQGLFSSAIAFVCATPIALFANSRMRSKNVLIVAILSLLFSFAIAILNQVAMQLVFAKQVIGISDVGSEVFLLYPTLSLLIPCFWISLISACVYSIAIRRNA
jgi:hypothetical protein